MKKIKSSSVKATLNYLFFEELPPKNIIEHNNDNAKNTKELPVTCLLSKPRALFSDLLLLTTLFLGFDLLKSLVEFLLGILFSVTF